MTENMELITPIRPLEALLRGVTLVVIGVVLRFFYRGYKVRRSLWRLRAQGIVRS